MAIGDEKSGNAENHQSFIEQQTDMSEESPPEDPNINIVMKCVLQSDVERFISCFENEEDLYHERVNDLMNERDDDGKSPLDMSAVLGRCNMLKELVNRGVDVNTTSKKGYSALHHAAAWGKISCLKILVESGCDLQARISTRERAREIAARYGQTECVDYLDWAEAKQNLVQTIVTMKETVTDPEKVAGRLSRDEKNTTVALCTEKMDWIDSTSGATTQDFITQKQEFDEAVTEVVKKLSEPPPEKPEKK